MSDSTFRKVIGELAGAFATAKRDEANEDSTYYKLKEDVPAWFGGYTFMRNVHEAVDSRLPDDWIYEHASRIADALDERELDSADDAREAIHEIADGLVDIYNTDRYEWLAMHLGNADLCDEAAEDQGLDSKVGIADRIAAGQFLALERIANSLVSQAEAEAESRDEEDE